MIGVATYGWHAFAVDRDPYTGACEVSRTRIARWLSAISSLPNQTTTCSVLGRRRDVASGAEGILLRSGGPGVMLMSQSM